MEEIEIPASTGCCFSSNLPPKGFNRGNGLHWWVILAVFFLALLGGCGGSTDSPLSDNSSEASPDTPTGVTATAGNGQISISWTSVSGAISYNIYWSTTSGVTKSTGVNITNATSGYTHTGLTNGTTYYYVVTAVNSYGESNESSEASATPSATDNAPSAPSVTATGENGQISISWDSVSGAASYNIYWSTTSGVTKTTGTKITGAISPYIHTGLTIGTTYYYVVTAIDSSNGESIESSEASATPSATWASVSAGFSHRAAINTDGTLCAWGDNSYGQLGDGTTTSRSSPTQIGADINWASVSAGGSNTVAIKTDGSLWAWGSNTYGRLGDGTTTDRHSPTQIGADTNWASVSTGHTHTVAIKTDNTLWAWGNNTYGMLGDGTTTDRHSPTQIGADTNWASVSAAGFYHTVAIKTDGTLWAWGNNGSGQLGDGTATDRSSPTQIGADTSWASVSAGNSPAVSYTVAIKTDGTLWAWGNNGSGQLGDGTTTDRHSPTQVGADTNWASVAAGGSHTVAIKTDGLLWAWGDNGYGQLGDGTTTSRSSPTQIGADTNWASVAAGTDYTVAIKTDGSLWAWGYNMP